MEIRVMNKSDQNQTIKRTKKLLYWNSQKPN